MNEIIGRGIDRTDGAAKVTGRARYAGDVSLPEMAYAWMVQSTVAKGRIVGFDKARAESMPGVIAIITHENAERLPQGGKAAVQPPAGRVISVLQSDRVDYNHQPIALVVAESLEQARDAAGHLVVRYAAEPAMLEFGQPPSALAKPKTVLGEDADSSRGDFGAAKAAATQSVQVTYTTPIEHHNPLEPHATVASWSNGQLTLYDSTQFIMGVRNVTAKTLGISPEQVTAISPFVGGGFGSKGSSWSHVVLAAMASRHVKRPVKLVLDRTQMFGPVGHRPHTQQALWLGARGDGRLAGISHDVVSETSAIEDWTESSAMVTRMLYASDAVSTSHRLARMNIATPTFTRAPGEASGSFALEAAMDELAYALKMDPVRLRLANHADSDPDKKKPFSSKSLRQCYEQGAERFGWARRDPRPGSMRDGRWRVGWGMATATYPTKRSKAEAEVFLTPDGRALVRSATHELGTGAYTVMTQVAAETLGYPLDKVTFELGDSRLPPAPVAGGSQSTASVSPAVKAACEDARRRLIEMASKDAASSLNGRASDDLTVIDGRVVLRATPAQGEPASALIARQGSPIHARAAAEPGPEKEAFSMHAFGAVFAEVRVDEDLGIVRVPRVVAAYGVGRVLNEKTARSQLMGGIVWGLGMALTEESVRDTRDGRYVTASLADYHVPVNADIGTIDVIVVPEDDPHVNPLGVKGIGEIGITGVAGAISNAVFHATGRRVRDLPITPDKLLGFGDA